MIYVFPKSACEEHQIEIASKNGLWYPTINQTINDLLADPTVDEQVILESLADQYPVRKFDDTARESGSLFAFQIDGRTL